MEVFLDDDTKVYRIEEAKQWTQETGVEVRMAPQSVIKESDKKKKECQKSARTKSFKHFNQVGYMGVNKKEVPRWATKGEGLCKVIRY